jgi:nucleoside-diphosphate-sugar epimerase
MYGRVKLLAEALAGRCEQFIAVGGVPAYQNVLEPGRFRPFGPALPAREDGPLADAQGEPPPFSGRILDAERTVLGLSAQGAFRGTVIRYPAIHGPRNQMPHEWLVLKRIADGRPYIVLPDGGLGIMSRCAAPNAAAVLLRCVDHADVAADQAYNCADDDQYCWRQWVDVVVDAAGGSLDVVSLPAELAEPFQASLVPLAGFAAQTWFDTTKAKAELGYREVVSARDQIAATVAWLQAEPPDTDSNIAFVDTFDYEREDRLVNAYRSAVDHVRETAGWDAPDLHHPLPHPRQPTGGKDELGR